MNVHFPEVPLSVTAESEWRLVQARRYSRVEPIHMLEGRAVLFGLRRRMRQACHHGQRHVFLSDNLALCLALEKGRAADPRLLRLCRSWGAFLLATGSRARVRWIASELNPSDGASRWFGSPLVGPRRMDAHPSRPRPRSAECFVLLVQREQRSLKRRPAPTTASVTLVGELSHWETPAP